MDTDYMYIGQNY